MTFKVMAGSLGRTLNRFFSIGFAVLVVSGMSAGRAHAAPVRQPMDVTGYVISADVDPATNHLAATADVTVTANEDLTVATFELNSGLNITKLTDKSGAALTPDRVAQN
jgi:hypothetical protein